MKPFLALLCFAAGALLSSCQCSEKPSVPPVDDSAARTELLYEVLPSET